MNRREFLKKTLEGIVIGSVPLISCSKNPVSSDLESRTKIAFNSNEENEDYMDNIYVINPDGTNKTRLTFGAHDENPSWSSDGKKIAFNSCRDQNFEIYVMNADGSEQTRLTFDPPGAGFTAEDMEPTWSPDGNMIAFRRGWPGKIYIMNADGSNQKYLVDGHYPMWSPDGREMAFVYSASHSYGADLYKIDLITTNITQITHYDGVKNTDVREPAWSPYGAKIAFTLATFAECPNGKIHLINPDGTGLEPLLSNLSIELNPAWSPDGNKIVFSNSHNIYIINTNGTNKTYLTDGFAPAWSPYLK